MKRWSQVLSFNKSFDKSKLYDDSDTLSKRFSTRKFMSKEFALENEVNLYLESLCMQNNNLVLLKDYKAILRRDHIFFKDQVKILSGGASGNEPLHAGFVGEGLLTAAVMGGINSCPSPKSILAVIRELAKNNSSIFVIIMNYASYRLNFGLAVQSAILEGIKIASVIVEDDCSGAIIDRSVGRQTLAGVVFMHKLVGAMAEDKKTLHEIESISRLVSKNNIGSINVHLSKDEVIYGIGLKGEPGKISITYGSKDESEITTKDSDQIVKTALSFIISPASYFSLPLKRNDTVAILVNNFQGISDLNLSVFINKIVNEVHSKPLNIVSFNFGNYLSSDSIHGFSVTLFKVNNSRVLKWLNVESSHGNLFTAKTVPTDNIILYVCEENMGSKQVEPRKTLIGPVFNLIDEMCVKNILYSVMNELIKCKEYINSLDFDNDCGTTLSQFALEVLKRLKKEEIIIRTPYALLTSLSEIAGSKMEGMSSGIYSVILSSAAQVFLYYSSQEAITYSKWAEAAVMASQTLQNFLKVVPSQRTIFDALLPFAEALKNNPTDVKTAIEAAEFGIEVANSMTPKTTSIEDNVESFSPDAGAYAFTLSVKTAYYAFLNADRKKMSSLFSF